MGKVTLILLSVPCPITGGNAVKFPLASDNSTVTFVPEEIPYLLKSTLNELPLQRVFPEIFGVEITLVILFDNTTIGISKVPPYLLKGFEAYKSNARHYILSRQS